VEEADTNREDRVEPSLAEIDRLELSDQELGATRLHEGLVPTPRSVDHLRRPIDRRQPAVVAE